MGQDVQEEFDRFEDDPLGTLADYTVNIGTGGFVGFDAERGALRPGIVPSSQINLLEAGEDRLKDITGATALEEQVRRGEARFQEEARRREMQLRQEQQEAFQRDLAASRTAAAARGGSRVGGDRGGRRRGRAAQFNGTVLGEEREFLGL